MRHVPVVTGEEPALDGQSQERPCSIAPGRLDEPRRDTSVPVRLGATTREVDHLRRNLSLGTRSAQRPALGGDEEHGMLGTRELREIVGYAEVQALLSDLTPRGSDQLLDGDA